MSLGELQQTFTEADEKPEGDELEDNRGFVSKYSRTHRLWNIIHSNSCLNSFKGLRRW